jgi:hypothetical protein
MARALMCVTLFPPCKVFCRVGVKGLLTEQQHDQSLMFHGLPVSPPPSLD